MESNQPIERTKLPDIKNIIIVASGKGGVGKSTIAAGMAISLARRNLSVGLLDADVYGPTLPILLHLTDKKPEIDEQEDKKTIHPFVRQGVKIMSIGLFVEPDKALLWRGPMISGALKQLIRDTDWGKLDYLIIDTPPGTGDIHLTLLQQYVIAGAVVVTTPQLVSQDIVKKAISLYSNPKIGIPILGIIENMSWFTPDIHPDEKYFLLGKGGGEELSKAYHIPLLTQIPFQENIGISCDEGKLEKMFENEMVLNAYNKLTDGIINLCK